MNAPGANSVSVAELAMALVLALARHIPGADAAMKQGKWEKKKFLGEEVRGKILGLVGLGRIGQEVARRASGFGMTISTSEHDAWDPDEFREALMSTLPSQPPPVVERRSQQPGVPLGSHQSGG